MAVIIYGLCALTAFFCAFFLLQAYRLNHYRLLLWGGICFVGLTFNNTLVIIDKFITPPGMDLSTWRLMVALASMLILMFGLIWDTE